MKILAVIQSSGACNAMQLAEAMSEVAPLTIVNAEDISYYNLKQYDAVGFAYDTRSNLKKLLITLKSIKNLPDYSFIFGTVKSKPKDNFGKPISSFFEKKGVIVLKCFCCKGFYKSFPILLNGKNKRHPDFNDFENAQNFIEEVVSKITLIKS